jgi:SNF2 family DNA or RNA helicase
MGIMTFNYKTQPMEHQRQALIKGAKAEKFAYFMEQGTGKTKVSIDNCVHLYNEEKINVVLIIAPNSVYRNWEDELEKHCSVDYEVQSVKKNKNFVRLTTKLTFFLINIESFSRGSGSDKVQSIIDEFFDTMMVIVDESSTIKNMKAKRTKSVIKVCKPIKYKRVLSGTPVSKSPLDLYSQCDFLQPGLLGVTNFYAFRARHAVMHTMTAARNFPIIKYYINLDMLENYLKTFSFRAKKNECLDLPNKIYQKRYVDLKGSQKSVYDNLKNFARAVFEDKEATYSNKLSEIIKLHSVCCGFFVSDEGEVQDLDNPKLNELLNIIDETDGKIIIWANYIRSIKQIISFLQNKFGKESVVAIYGAVSVDERKVNVHKFQTDEKVRFFVGNPTTGGYGLNLTEAQTVVYFSNNYDLEVRLQSEDRAHRIGQKNKVTYIDLLCRDSIEEFILKALNKKIKISAQTLGEEVLEFL